MNKLDRILQLFSGIPEEYSRRGYRGVSYLLKMDGTVSIKLMYGYNKNRNPIYSDEIEPRRGAESLEVLRILENGMQNMKVEKQNTLSDILSVETKEIMRRDGWQDTN